MIPMTLVTATSLVFMLIATFTVRKLSNFDPTNPISLIVAASGPDFYAAMQSINDPEGTAAWRYQLQYNEEQGRFAVMSGGQRPSIDLSIYSNSEYIFSTDSYPSYTLNICWNDSLNVSFGFMIMMSSLAPFITGE